MQKYVAPSAPLDSLLLRQVALADLRIADRQDCC